MERAGAMLCVLGYSRDGACGCRAKLSGRGGERGAGRVVGGERLWVGGRWEEGGQGPEAAGGKSRVERVGGWNGGRGRKV